MIESRQYRGLDLEIVKAKSSRVCYFLLPEGLKSEGLKFLEDAAEQYGVPPTFAPKVTIRAQNS